MNDSNDSDRAGEPSGSLRVVQITTGARLHFGLFDTVAPFGGVGVMIDQPVTEVRVEPAESFRCADELSNRLTPIAQRVARLMGFQSPLRCRIDVVRRAESHCGLGSGTQLALAASEALCLSVGLRLERDDLATQVASRGKRSAIGIHGYFGGGLVLERGDAPPRRPLNPILDRCDLPEHWRVVVLRPAEEVAPVSGELEKRQFAGLSAAPAAVRQSIEDLAVEMLDAAKQNDFARFADRLERYNRHSGMLFEPIQNGVYNGPEVTELIDTLRRRGAVGVGQSSWGPGVFAWFESAIAAHAMVDSLPPSIQTIAVASPTNQPRRVNLANQPSPG